MSEGPTGCPRCHRLLEPVALADVIPPCRVDASGIFVAHHELFCSYPSQRRCLIEDGIPGVNDVAVLVRAERLQVSGAFTEGCVTFELESNDVNVIGGAFVAEELSHKKLTHELVEWSSEWTSLDLGELLKRNARFGHVLPVVPATIAALAGKNALACRIAHRAEGAAIGLGFRIAILVGTASAEVALGIFPFNQGDMCFAVHVVPENGGVNAGAILPAFAGYRFPKPLRTRLAATVCLILAGIFEFDIGHGSDVREDVA